MPSYVMELSAKYTSRNASSPVNAPLGIVVRLLPDRSMDSRKGWLEVKSVFHVSRWLSEKTIETKFGQNVLRSSAPNASITLASVNPNPSQFSVTSAMTHEHVPLSEEIVTSASEERAKSSKTPRMASMAIVFCESWTPKKMKHER